MRHAVMFTCYNQLHLTKKALASVAAQDIGELDLYVVNNGSTDGTKVWLDEYKASAPANVRIELRHSNENISPVQVANWAIGVIFRDNHDKVLMVPNDVILPPNAYRLMSEWPRGVVCASQTASEQVPVMETTRAASENTPMALLLLRRWAYDALIARDGYLFDERFFHYASDMDFALRLTTCGIRGVQLDFPYWHYCSASYRLAPPDEHREACRQADVDRKKFVEKYGWAVDSEEYVKAATDINFRGGRE